MKLNKKKIKPLSYLMSKFIEKESQFGTPKNCFLLGAGCSITSKIPSGWGVLEICRKLSFVQHHPGGHKLGHWYQYELNGFLNTVDDYIRKNQSDYDKFIEQNEKSFLDNLTATEITQKLPRNLSRSGDETKLFKAYKEKFANDNLYGQWFEQFSEDPRERQRLIEKIIEQHKLSGEYILFANLIKNKFIHNVFTTNFDDLIYDALVAYTDTKARVYSHNEVVKYLSIGSEKPNIIKLHGDYLYENIKNIGKETFELEENMKVKFEEALNHLDLIVVGYGGADKSIMAHLEELKEERSFGLIWCGRNEEKLHWRVINLINNTKNSFFVKIENFSSLIFNFWKITQIEPVNLIEKAEENQKQLNKYIDDFNKNISKTTTITDSDKQLLNARIESNKLFQLAFKESRSNNFAKALELYNKSIELNPNNSQAYINRGIIYANNKKQYDLALKDYELALELNKSSPWLYYNIGCLLEKQDDFKGALQNYEIALLMDEMPAEQILNNMAVAQRRSGRAELARETANKSIAVNPDLSLTYGTIALSYADEENHDKFYEYITIALEKGANVWDYLDDSGFNQVKDTEKFKELLEKYKPKNS